jgi:hypothetical protein
LGSPLDPSTPDDRRAGAAAGGSASDDFGCTGFYTARDSRNLRRFQLWMLAAALGYIGATSALRWRASLPTVVVWLILAGDVLLGAQVARSYIVFLRQADELLRRIHTEALALAFVLGAAFSVFYPLLVMLGAPDLGGHAVAVLMMFAWSLGSWFGERRYARGGDA